MTGREDKVLSQEHVILSITFVVLDQDKLWRIWFIEEYPKEAEANLECQDLIDFATPTKT